MRIDSRHLLKWHIVTEKTTVLKEKNNEYVFEVDKKASKYDIKTAVETAFKVKVATVRTVIMPGKIRRMGRFAGKTPTWKKAFVRLQAGQNITVFENV
jgi:large subunit ribosomal protein L23